MNARTQITMDPEMQRRAHAKAAELGISFAEYVRRVVAQDLGEAKRKADISSSTSSRMAPDQHRPR